MNYKELIFKAKIEDEDSEQLNAGFKKLLAEYLTHKNEIFISSFFNDLVRRMHKDQAYIEVLCGIIDRNAQ